MKGRGERPSRCAASTGSRTWGTTVPPYSDCNAGLVCDVATKKCKPDEMCGAMTTSVAAIPPNLLVVLDRSCSMTDKVVGTTTKWMLAVAAINKMTTDFNGKIRFGLRLKRSLFHAKSEFQSVDVVETEEFGRALALEDAWMTSERD